MLGEKLRLDYYITHADSPAVGHLFLYNLLDRILNPHENSWNASLMFLL